MKRLMVFGLISAVCACAYSPPATYTEPFIRADDSVQLAAASIDGSGWQVDDDGLISPLPTEDMTYLYTEGQYQDFVLIVEFFPVGNVNSGIFIRCQDPAAISASTCYEINIWDDHPNQRSRTGAIVTLAEPPLNHVDSVGKWNTAEITAYGGNITVRMNGVLTTDYEVEGKQKFSNGFLALQRANAGTIRFRNIRLESLE